MTSKIRAGSTKMFRKLAFAILVALLFAFLGLFDNVGYRVDSIQESLIPNQDYVDVNVSFEATHNPVLYPFC